MSENFHTPVIATDLVNQTVTEAPFADLDQAITDLLAGTLAIDRLDIGSGGAEVLTEYASSNQDSDVELQGRSYAGGTVDTNASGSTGNIGTNSGGVIVRRAQSFTIGQGIFTTFDVSMGANNGSPTGTITWSIQTNSGSVPSGSVLATGTFTPVASSVNTVNVPLAQQIVFAAATTYWLVFESTNTQATNVFWNIVRQTTSSYAGGNDAVKLDAAAWSAQTGELDIVVTSTSVTKNDKLAQGIQIDAEAEITSVRLWLKKVGTPTGNLTVKLQTDSAGSPSGTPVTNGTSDVIAASTLATSYGWITFTFAINPTLAAATQYHIVLETADTQSNSNYVVWGADSSSPSYADGEMQRERSAAWSAQSADACFDVNGIVDYSASTLINANSTTQGWLPPRMTTAQRDAIPSPANGMVIYNTTTNLLNVYNSGWETVVINTGGNAALTELIAPTTVTAQASVSINIPAGYKDILIRVLAQSNAGGAPFQLYVRFNSDTGTNYRYTIDTNSTIAAVTTDNAASGFLVPIGDNDYYMYEIWIFNYEETGNYRAVSIEGAKASNDNPGNDSRILAGLWENTANAIATCQLTEGNASTWDGEYAVYGLS